MGSANENASLICAINKRSYSQDRRKKGFQIKKLKITESDLEEIQIN